MPEAPSEDAISAVDSPVKESVMSGVIMLEGMMLSSTVPMRHREGGKGIVGGGFAQGEPTRALASRGGINKSVSPASKRAHSVSRQQYRAGIARCCWPHESTTYQQVLLVVVGPSSRSRTNEVGFGMADVVGGSAKCLRVP